MKLHEQIQEQMTEAGWTDLEGLAIWNIGVAAYKAMKAEGASFHQVKDEGPAQWWECQLCGARYDHDGVCNAPGETARCGGIIVKHSRKEAA